MWAVFEVVRNYWTGEEEGEAFVSSFDTEGEAQTVCDRLTLEAACEAFYVQAVD